MTSYPNAIDSDLDLPPIYDNIVELGAEAIQAIRAAMFAVENEIGIGASGTMGSVAGRLDVSINNDGTIKPSSIIGIGAGLVSNAQVNVSANIDESKINLTYTTAFLHTLFNNLFNNLDNRVDIVEGFVAASGVKIEPHIAGSGFRHKLSHIDVDSGSLLKANIAAGTVIARNLTNAYTFGAELSADLLSHTRADKLSNTTTPPANQAHNAAGIYINPSNFASVPHTANDLQSFAEYVDGSSLALLGSRTQNLYANGIPRSTRNTSLTNNLGAEALLDPTPAITYLLYSAATTPVDNIDHGDDVILLVPSAGVLSNNTFDAQFAQVKSGDYITVDYGNGTASIKFTIDSTKKFLNGSTRVYTIRINGKNLYASSTATVKIDRAFYHDSKFNSLALAIANNSFSELPSLIVSNPSGASALGIGFDPDKLDRTHYNLYLELYPNGNPLQKTLLLPAIDVTADAGNSVGSYSLASVVENINNKFRAPGFNFRFIAFAYQGQLGIALADRYNNASFSIIAGVPNSSGTYITTSNASFPGNVVDNYNVIDPLGFGLTGANIASPPFTISYSSPTNALQAPVVIFSPLKKNFFYVDGIEKETLFSDGYTVTQDGYGDGFWSATLTTKSILAGRVEVTYEIALDLSTSGLKIGKTLVIQPAVAISSGSYNIVDYGRFLIKDIAFNNCPGPSPTTIITVYDAVHGTGTSPYLSSVNLPVYVYFSDDSVSFNAENVNDPLTNVSFKRFFEIYVDGNGRSFAHERARFNEVGTDLVIDSVNSFTLYSSIELSSINLVDVSPKLRGYTFGQYKKLALFINSYDSTTGAFNGYLCKFESPSTYTRLGPVTYGKKGETTRFYDDTTVDYIDIIIPFSVSVSSFTNKKIDIQLYPTLQLNQEKILIGTCQLSDTAKQISYLTDKRQFGNVSEKQLSTSALSYINAPQRLLHENGVVRGFDLVTSTTLTNDNKISVRGGVVLADGKLVDFNDTTVAIPIVQESLSPAFTTAVTTIKWYLCVNSNSEFEFVASTDYDLSMTGTYGALNHNRLFYVKNPASASPTAYPIRGSYLNKILTDSKDLVPLYLVTATVALSGTWKVTSATITDLRRFVEKGYNGLSNTFTLGQQASFRNLTSVKAYINELTSYISYNTDKRNPFGKTVYVRDIVDASGFNFDFAVRVQFVGDNGKFTLSSSATLTKNIEFKELDIAVTCATGFNIIGDNISFDNCNIDYVFDATGDGYFTTANLSNPAKACILSSGTDIVVTNATATNPIQITTSTATQLVTGDTVNILGVVGITAANGTFTITVIDSTHFTLDGISGVGTYTSGGMVGSKNKNIQITNCKFTSSIATRFAFVSLLLGGQESYYGNILIDKNKVSTTATGDDKRAAFVIACTQTATPTSQIGPRVANCNITNNVCNKNQLILISGAYNGSSKVVNMPVPVGIHIEKNICGAICFLVRQDRSLNLVNATNINDKDNMLTISKNMCRYIYCGTSNGFINVIGSANRVINDIVVGSDIYSSSAIIDQNTCSWIQVGVKNPTTYAFETPMLDVSSNKLNAYVSTFLTDYCGSGYSAFNIALIIDSVVGT